MRRLRFLVALWLAKFARLVINTIAPSRGTTFPGRLATMLASGFVGQFKGIDKDKIIYITGTNGKSTTTNLLAAILKEANVTAAVNLEGANLQAGVAVTLLSNATWSGRFKCEYIVMETDERFLPIISKYLPPAWLCVTNIQKDQVQRNGEPDIIYRKISEALTSDPALFLNSEDPNAASLKTKVSKSIFFGVEENAKSYIKKGFYTTTMPCPLCGSPIRFLRYNIDNVGEFACSNCSFASEKAPDYFATKIDFLKKTFIINAQVYPLPYEAPYFIYCYTAALAMALEMGISPAICAKALGSFVNIGGRLEQLVVNGKTIRYIRMKQENPETLQSALDYIATDHKPKIFILGLDELVDFAPHYTNTFYAYDCDFDQLAKSGVERYICFSGTVAFDAANRLVYAGIAKEKISVIASNNNQELLDELAKYDCPNVYLITWLYKYKALEKYLKGNAKK